MSKKKNDSVWTKIWKIAINTILIAFMLIGLVIVVSVIPIRGNYKILAVMSGSMAPTIPTGALVVVKPISEYKIGDVITFKTPGSSKVHDYTTHRLVKIVENNSNITYVTKGDANEDNDVTRIAPSDVLGKQFYSIALFGYAIGYIKTLPGLLILIIVPAIVIIYEEVNKIKKEVKIFIKKISKKKIKKADNEAANNKA